VSADPTIIRRARGILAHIKRNSGPEAETARAIYERFLQMYDLDPDLIDEATRKRFRLKCKGGTRWMALHIGQSLGLLDDMNFGRKSTVLYVECTNAEFSLLSTLYACVVELQSARLARARMEVKSYVMGYMEAAHPLQTSDLKCQRCGKQACSLDEEQQRYVCSACGYRARKQPRHRVDPDALDEGIRDGRKKLPQLKLLTA